LSPARDALREATGDRGDRGCDVLVVTDRRFWRRSIGSEQRIANLVLHLGRSGRRVDVAALDRATSADAVAIAAFEAEVPGVAIHSRRRTPRNLWPGARNGARRRFVHSAIRTLRPAIVLVEYLRLADAMPSMRETSAPHAGAGPSDRQRHDAATPAWWIDTHDVQHRRAARQRRAGARVQRPIEADEEARALSRFDTIVAIQPLEAAVFRRMLPDADVLVAPHGLDLPVLEAPAPATSQGDARSPTRLGFLGGRDEANRRGLDWFVTEVWPALRDRFGAAIELCVGGEVGRSWRSAVAGVVTLGPVPTIDAFWPDIDLAVAPVPYGSGLQIKNVEALAWARPLLTTSIGAEGLESALPDGLRVADEAADWIGVLSGWIRDPAAAAAIGRRGRAAAEGCWSCSAAFGALDRRIDAVLAVRRG
jgi:glycosyltransferase involved in cell wall biosynthesis